jgi:GDP-L-fucose synthase
MKILATGSTGFVGTNVIPELKRYYNIDTPCREELDLLNSDEVRTFLKQGKYDAVIHLANPTAQNPIDKKSELFERSLRVFTSLAHCSDLYGKMIYLGSGAEYGKHRALKQISENEFGTELPRDGYGLSRYIMNDIAESKGNIINFRLFACCGPNDPPYKLIQHVINCIKRGEPITQRQNMLFDFLYVSDITPVFQHFIKNEAVHKAYNLCSGMQTYTADIAKEVKRQMNSNLPIIYDDEEIGLEYTGSNTRLRSELPKWKPTDIFESIRRILSYEDWKI